MIKMRILAAILILAGAVVSHPVSWLKEKLPLCSVKTKVGGLPLYNADCNEFVPLKIPISCNGTSKIFIDSNGEELNATFCALPNAVGLLDKAKLWPSYILQSLDTQYNKGTCLTRMGKFSLKNGLTYQTTVNKTCPLNAKCLQKRSKFQWLRKDFVCDKNVVEPLLKSPFAMRACKAYYWGDKLFENKCPTGHSCDGKKVSIYPQKDLMLRAKFCVKQNSLPWWKKAWGKLKSFFG